MAANMEDVDSSDDEMPAHIGVVKCIIDFDATNEVELTIKVGDLIQVTRKDVGGGWWEGELRGALGLFPEKYVTEVSDAPPAGDGGDAALQTPKKAATSEAIPDTPATPSTPDSSAVERFTSLTTSPTVLAGCKWAGAGEFKPERYIITANEGKGRKFSGMKSFTTYEISTESSNVSVERRFKHFTWFRDQLQRIYPFVTVPPIPEKQLKGRFSSDFVQQRCQGLQQFLNRLAVHPVLHDAAVVKHFLSATEQKEWKSGKRLAEQQPVFLGTLVLKDGPATVGKNQGELDNLITQSSQFAVWLQDNLGKWNNAGESMGTHFQELSASYQKMSETVKTFDAVADGLRFKTWWSTEDSCPVNELMGSLANLGTTMEHVGIMMSQHNEVQMGSLISALNEYSSLVKAIPTVAHGLKWKEDVNAGATDPMVVSNVVLSEFRHFHETLGTDLKLIVETFIQQQVAYHRQIASTWESLLPSFSK